MSTNSVNSKALVLFYNRRHHPAIISNLPKSGITNIETAIIDLGEIKNHELLIDEISRSGSSKTHYVNGVDRFARDYLSWMIMSNAVYLDKYYLSAAIARPCLVDISVELAKKTGATTIVHGFRGNDMIRMNVGYQNHAIEHIPALSHFKISTDEVNAIANKLGIPEEFGTCNPYSVSDNIWGRSIECGPLENLTVETPKESYGRCSELNGTTHKQINIKITFQNGVPVAFDDNPMPLHQIITTLDNVCGARGIGRFDLIEDGVVGFKTRAIYEHPAAHCIIQAHKEIETLTLNRHELEFKRQLDNQFAKNIYAGLWYDPVMSHMKESIKSINNYINGSITLRLMSGTFDIVSRSSPNALYNKEISVYNYGHLFSEGDSSGYTNTFNLHTCWANKVRGLK